jgi:uncharacterized membrane protein YuzA (DUF378 family)
VAAAAEGARVILSGVIAAELVAAVVGVPSILTQAFPYLREIELPF